MQDQPAQLDMLNERFRNSRKNNAAHAEMCAGRCIWIGLRCVIHLDRRRAFVALAASGAFVAGTGAVATGDSPATAQRRAGA